MKANNAGTTPARKTRTVSPIKDSETLPTDVASLPSIPTYQRTGFCGTCALPIEAEQPGGLNPRHVASRLPLLSKGPFDFMKITIESTTKIVQLKTQSGAVVAARIWEGTTASGTPVHCFVTRIAPTLTDQSDPRFKEFERELLEQVKPSSEITEIPLHLIL